MIDAIGDGYLAMKEEPVKIAQISSKEYVTAR